MEWIDGWAWEGTVALRSQLVEGTSVYLKIVLEMAIVKKGRSQVIKLSVNTLAG